MIRRLQKILGLSKKKTLDALVLVLYFAALVVITPAFSLGLFVGTMLWFILPGFYLVLRYWRENYHAFLFSIVAGVATGFPMQVAAELNGVWDYNFPAFDFFQFAGLRMVPLGWYVVWIGLIISVYSVFFDTHVHPVSPAHRFWKKHYPFLLCAAAVIAGSAFLVLAYPSIFIVPYPYVVYGTLLWLVPTLVIFFFHPHLLRDVFKAAIFLSFFALVYEVVGLKAGWWEYPGEYLASLPVLGVSIPIEEMLFWVVLGSFWAITLYEKVEGEDNAWEWKKR